MLLEKTFIVIHCFVSDLFTQTFVIFQPCKTQMKNM